VVTPASTLKVLTSTAALETLGPEHRFSTSVTLDGNRLTLVGGGDPLLTRRADPEAYPVQADLVTLARRTAHALGEAGRTRVTLGYDTSLFSGPSVNPSWEPDYVPDDVVSPISPLWIDEGRVSPGQAERVADPAAAAAAAFADELRAQGIVVRGRPASTTSPEGADPVASVESAELVEIVQHLLETSDNEATEVLARHVAISQGEPGSFEDGARQVTTVLTGLDVDMRGAELHDGSGLSRSDRVPVQALIDTLAVAADPDHPALAGVLEGLPVAGFTGSASYRFATLDGASEAGLGRARLKTGTLTGVHGYAGVVVGRDGAVMLLVEIVDKVRVPQTLFARDQLDRIAAALAGCACAASGG
jgi:D-alanyl-D-alanine carboxypeptidase/D-alanyl-D-alanine-endopeptidase (penicillin-binding protein 4)